MNDDDDRKFWRDWYTLTQGVAWVLAVMALVASLGLCVYCLTLLGAD